MTNWPPSRGRSFLRGMAALEPRISVFATMAHGPSPGTNLIAGQTRLDRISSEYASRQRGSVNVSFGAGLPMVGSMASTLTAGSRHGRKRLQQSHRQQFRRRNRIHQRRPPAAAAASRNPSHGQSKSEGPDRGLDPRRERGAGHLPASQSLDGLRGSSDQPGAGLDPAARARGRAKA